jgi:predicted HD phosphohydrolase
VADSEIGHQLVAVLARSDNVFDEPGVSLLAHALQCGAILLAEHPDDEELAVAGLFHDIADALTPGDHHEHDRRGADLVRPAWGDRVAHLVGSHVGAKRYLVTSDAAYRAALSERSIETLIAQGDRLAEQTFVALDADPDRDAILALRRADDRAKDPDAIVPGLDAWLPVLERLGQ